MSIKTEYAKKWIIEILEKQNFDILDEILHPELSSDQDLALKDREWEAMTSSIFKAYIPLNQVLPKRFDEETGLPLEPGIEGAKNLGRDFFSKKTMTPAFKIKMHDIIESENTVVITYTHSFVHDKQYFGIKPSYQEIKHNAVRIFYFQDNKIARMRLLSDTYQLLTAMGTIVINGGDEEQIRQYMEMLRKQNLIPNITRD
jgi:hypothetical protein